MRCGRPTRSALTATASIPAAAGSTSRACFSGWAPRPTRSSSPPRGAPDDFYARLCASARARRTRFVLDSSGPELKATLTGGGIFLVKPSRAELEEVAGRPLLELPDLARAARELRQAGGAELV